MLKRCFGCSELRIFENPDLNCAVRGSIQNSFNYFISKNFYNNLLIDLVVISTSILRQIAKRGNDLQVALGCLSTTYIQQCFCLSHLVKQRCKLLDSMQRVSSSSEDKMYCITFQNIQFR